GSTLLEELGDVVRQLEVSITRRLVAAAERRRQLPWRRLLIALVFGGGKLRRALGRIARPRSPLALLALFGLLALALLAADTWHPGHATHAGHPWHPAAELAAGGLAHHVAGHEEPLDQLIDVADLGAGPAGDTCAARAVDDLRVGPLCRRHRLDDRLDAVELAFVGGVQRFAHLPGSGEHADDALERAHLLDRLHLLQEVVEGEVLAALGLQFAGHLLGFG